MQKVRLAVLFALVAACGRIGFDDQADAPNDVPDASNYREPGGRLDPTFGTGGQTVLGSADTEHAEDVALRPGGGYLVAGFRGVGGATTFEVIALTADGLVDPSYGNNGFAFATIANDDFGYGLVTRPDGSTLMVGDGGIGGNDDIVVGVVDDRGAVVTSYATNGFRVVDSGPGFGDTSRRAVQAGNTTYVCGTIRYDQVTSEVALLALDSQGQGVPSFDGDGVVYARVTAQNNHCSDILIDRSGRIVITGKTGIGAMIARYNADGRIDASFNTVGFVSVTTGQSYGIALAANDDLLAAGENDGDGIILRRDTTGASVSFGTGGVLMLSGTPLADIVIQPNGKIIVAGERGGGSANIDIVIVRRNADGSPDPSFGTGGELVIDVSSEDRIRALAQDPDGKLIAVGYVKVGAAERPWIARIE